MKPLRLEIEGFGSFPGKEVIDFAALAHRGLFVVTGPTGAGKSTIFDAMVYALYGKLPGDRNVAEIRSQHVDHTTPTRVVLDFALGDNSYRITRNPTHERASKRGAGTATQAAGATLEVVGDEASLTTGSDACTARATEIIGLNATQFERVILLPQGKFDQFLIAGDDVREALLATLFGGAVYKSLTDRFKALADNLQTTLSETGRAIDTHRAESWNALRRAQRLLAVTDDDDPHGEDDGAEHGTEMPDRNEVGVTLALALEAAEELEKRRDTESERASNARKAATSATNAAERFDTARLRRRDIAALEEIREEIEREREFVKSSKGARPVCELAKRADEARNHAERAADRERAARNEVMSRMKGLQCPSADDEHVSPTAAAIQISEARTTAGNDEQSFEIAREASAAVDDAESKRLMTFVELVAAHAAHAAAAVDSVEAEKRVSTAKHGAGKLDLAEHALTVAHATFQARSELDTLRALVHDLHDELRNATEQHKDAMRRYVANEAPRLAEKLVDGDPCPVCGSPEHPRPAVLVASVKPSTYDDVLGASKVETDARVAAETTASDIRAAEASLGPNAFVGIDALQHAVEDATKAVDAAKAADRELIAAEEALTATRAAVDDTSRVFRESHIAFRDACLALYGARDTAMSAAAAVRGIDAADLDRRQALLWGIDDVISEFEIAIAEAKSKGDDFSRAKLEAATTLNKSDFTTLDAARAALLSDDDEEARSRKVADFDEQLKEADTKLRAIEALGVPDVKPDVEALHTFASTTEERAGKLAERATLVREHLSACSDRLSRADELTNRTASDRAKAETVRTVHETFAGKGAGVATNLYRWVLAGELERVAIASNEHLRRLTDSRYEVHPGEKLALMIFDAHTGAERSPKSLSGGERFQVSLALALGLADVVSHGGTGSGLSYDALFLDEGFGTLDPEALDDAISALIALQAGGRIVGAITHVEAMKEQLHVGIEVQRLAGGSGSTLVVHP